MKKILFGVFAHPDDEAFGPVATLLKEVSEGTELHLIVLTGGENGTNPDNLPNLGEVRIQEWRAAGELIGATSMHHLGYIDGTLNNLDHLEVTDKVTELVKEITAGHDDIEIEFMSLDLNGYTGHIDHIVAARSACLAFYRLREQGLPMKRIRLACISREENPAVNTHFVFMEPGRTPEEIDETVDGREFTDKIHEVMRLHHTQRGDYQTVTTYKGDKLGLNYFIVKE
jgi:LmbE family N-acetylglucosaminyl deacetylase